MKGKFHTEFFPQLTDLLREPVFGLPDPDPLVRGTDPDPAIINQK